MHRGETDPLLWYLSFLDINLLQTSSGDKGGARHRAALVIGVDSTVGGVSVARAVLAAAANTLARLQNMLESAQALCR